MAGAMVTIMTSFFVNLPLGRWRKDTRKFSPSWFLAVHLSIPLIFWLRHHFNLGIAFIPFSIGSAVLGQLLGSHKIQIINSNQNKRRKMQ